ncbi:MAG: hypothetical protein HC799_19170 [Limnothrix sp. RL_2_0]|nr:hypothetical protein [Limnothrix sp. RL_2_0]
MSTNFNKSAIRQLNRITAQKIFEKMRILRMSPTENAKRRWIWELLQNAKDKAAIDFPDKKVKIHIEYTSDALIFSHNYGYFSTENIEGVIRQISSEDKDREEDENLQEQPKTTGRFGTGFMTTHLLSEKVDVKGLYRDENHNWFEISFPLDRSGKDLPHLIESIDHSFECAENNINEILEGTQDFSKFNTKFTYNLTEKSRENVEKGLEDLELSLPYTLIFIDRIESVEIKINKQSIFYKIRKSEKLSELISHISFEKVTDNQKEYFDYISLSSSLTTVVLPVVPDETSSNVIKFEKRSVNLSKLFLDFPLIGTEKFGFPLIINNPFLEPTEPRDGIFLTDEEGEHILKNKNIILEATSLYIKLLDYAVENNWGNLFYLANICLPEEEKHISLDWYTKNVQTPIIEALLDSEIVYTQSDKVKLKDSVIPKVKKGNDSLFLWDLLKDWYFEELPRREDLEFWHECLDPKQIDNLYYGLPQFAADIESYENLNVLAEVIQLTMEDSIIWLNKSLEFIHKLSPKLLLENSIIPNQYGDFKKLDELYFDDHIPEVLKDVLNILGEDWRINLLHSSISKVQPKSQKDLKNVTDKINKIISDNTQKININAIFLILSCQPLTTDQKLMEKRKTLWRFSRDFYPETPDAQDLNKYTNNLWEASDNHFLRYLLQDIQSKNTLDSLTLHLGDNASKWLNHLIEYIVINDLLPSFNLREFSIVPNQYQQLKSVKHLLIDQDIDESIKDISVDLGFDCRDELVYQDISLSSETIQKLELKSQSLKEVANEIKERVENILKDEGLQGSSARDRKTKSIFESILLWFHSNESLASSVFGDLYEKRHKLRTDEEIIEDIRFKQKILSNANKYSEEEILKLVEIPRDQLSKLLIFTDNISIEELQELLKYREQLDQEQSNLDSDIFKIEIISENLEILNQERDEISIDDILLSLGIFSLEELERARVRFANSQISKYLYSFDGYDYKSRFLHVHTIIERAKRNIQTYLMAHPQYDCQNWHEESITVISGIRKNNREIQLVIRPSDGGKVILYYPEEIETLKKPDAEFWIDNDIEQRILTLGQVLQYMGVYYIRLA